MLRLYDAPAADRFVQIVKEIRERYGEPQSGGWMGGELAMAMHYLAHTLNHNVGMIEIGSANGVSFAAWARVIPHGAHISIDLANATCTWTQRLSVEKRNQQWAEDVAGCVSILASSHSDVAQASVEAILDGSKVDFLFIDADHSYTAARKDFELYEKHVRKGGIVAFHDTHHPQHGRTDCGKVFTELARRYDATAITEGMGIGFVRKTWEDGCADFSAPDAE